MNYTCWIYFRIQFSVIWLGNLYVLFLVCFCVYIHTCTSINFPEMFFFILNLFIRFSYEKRRLCAHTHPTHIWHTSEKMWRLSEIYYRNQ